VNEAIQQALTAITLADMQDASIPIAFRQPAAHPVMPTPVVLPSPGPIAAAE